MTSAVGQVAGLDVVVARTPGEPVDLARGDIQLVDVSVLRVFQPWGMILGSIGWFQ